MESEILDPQPESQVQPEHQACDLPPEPLVVQDEAPQLAEPEPAPPIRLAAEIHAIDDTNERDVFVAGYPKSGNTWCQSCVSAMLYGFDIARTPETIIQSLVPDVHFRQHYLRFQTPTCFKTHHLPQPHYRRVIHLLRDGRDAMTSFYHYKRDCKGIEGNDWESIMRDGAFNFTQWHEHVELWQQNPYDAEIITVRYEDMKLKTIPTLARIADFLGVDLTTDQLRQIAEMTTFGRMKEREQRLGWAQPFPKDKAFVRRGVVGSYKDEMPPEILKRFEEVSEPALRDTGYWTEEDTARHAADSQAA